MKGISKHSVARRRDNVRRRGSTMKVSLLLQDLFPPPIFPCPVDGIQGLKHAVSQSVSLAGLLHFQCKCSFDLDNFSIIVRREGGGGGKESMPVSFCHAASLPQTQWFKGIATVWLRTLEFLWVDCEAQPGWLLTAGLLYMTVVGRGGCKLANPGYLVQMSGNWLAVSGMPVSLSLLFHFSVDQLRPAYTMVPEFQTVREHACGLYPSIHTHRNKMNLRIIFK